MKGITKEFPGVLSNDAVDLTINWGEVHSLLGENGAGKTTLMKILYGMYKPNKGTIEINGKPVEIHAPEDAIRLGICMVHQHFMLEDTLTVTENIILGAESKRGLFLDLYSAEKRIAILANEYKLRIDPREKVANLSVGEKQRVEILKALYRDAKILILDEPTAVLTPLEVEDLFRIITSIREQGRVVILITHKLNETRAIADRISILRNGKLVDSFKNTHSTKELAKLMIGRERDAQILRENFSTRKEVLKAEQLNFSSKKGFNKLTDIEFTLHTHEILGIAGVDGNGQSELIKVLTGMERASSGCLLLEGHDILNETTRNFIRKGIGHIPEDRNAYGLVSEFNLAENYILGYHDTVEYQKYGLLKHKKINRFCTEMIKLFDVRSPGNWVTVKTLSGGNQQKVIIGRVLSHKQKIIVAAQPTRGVDIGAVDYIHNQLIDMRNRGVGIVLISTELDEILRLSDRILVMYEGKIVACLENNKNVDLEQISLLMTKGKV